MGHCWAQDMIIFMTLLYTFSICTYVCFHILKELFEEFYGKSV
jgi:hypothetical protein